MICMHRAYMRMPAAHVLTAAVHAVHRDGRVAGLQEGRDLGKAKGYEIGYEVGLYEGGVPKCRPPGCL